MTQRVGLGRGTAEAFLPHPAPHQTDSLPLGQSLAPRADIKHGSRGRLGRIDGARRGGEIHDPPTPDHFSERGGGRRGTHPAAH